MQSLFYAWWKGEAVETMLFKKFKLSLICTKHHYKGRNRSFRDAKYLLSYQTTCDSSKNFLWVFVELTEFK